VQQEFTVSYFTTNIKYLLLH